VITNDADEIISACGTNRTTCVLAAALTDAGSIDGPVVYVITPTTPTARSNYS
jgi:hypothetical protein